LATAAPEGSSTLPTKSPLMAWPKATLVIKASKLNSATVNAKTFMPETGRFMMLS
jgi:hypothetical protein